MDALDVLRVCLRRWYVVLPVLMLALGTGFALAARQQSSYYASSTFAFVYQASDAEHQDQRLLNPMQDNELLGTALGLSLAAPEMQDRLGDPAASGVEPGQPSEDTRFAFSGSGYTYTISSWGPTPESVQATVENVMSAVPDEVERIQVAAGAPAGSLSTIFVMSPTRVETVPPSSGAKVIIGVGAVGAIAGAALAIALDSVLASRDRRARRAVASGDAAAGEELAQDPNPERPPSTPLAAPSAHDADDDDPADRAGTRSARQRSRRSGKPSRTSEPTREERAARNRTDSLAS